MEGKFEQFRTKLPCIPKFLLSPILKKKIVLVSTNTGSNKPTTLKSLKEVLFKAEIINFKA
ncbi:hypothetical protein MA16_Dca025499 [Dendrobium catenatum]|uniref:Uncharacterized protein n=1 Tax=Dendrobium catenatum TaxID=906689 RepID=A0A2I0VUX6_9ASPA|nr:hypothetical protein MA16_Dca025499 [Dendrobium catenatum]